MQLYTQKEANLSLKFDAIETDKRIYEFKHEIHFDLIDEKNSVQIENPVLDIYAFGSTLEEAEQDLFAQFDYTYQRLNQIDNDKLSKHLLDAKVYINLLVGKIKDK